MNLFSHHMIFETSTPFALQATIFANQWKMEDGESMFDKNPDLVVERPKNKLCACSEEMDIVMGEEEEVEKVENAKEDWTEEECMDGGLVRHYSLFDTEDVTDLITGKGLDYVSRGKGKYWDVASSLVKDFPEEKILPGPPPGLLHLPSSPSRLTDDAVFQLCSNTLLNSTLAEVCGPHLEQDLSQALGICALDVSLTDSPNWAAHSLLLLAAQCEASILAQRLSWPLSSQGQLKEPAGVREALNVPFTLIKEILPLPVLLVAGQGSICDLKSSPCHQFQVKGRHLQPGSRMACRLRPLALTSPLEWQYTDQHQQSEAEWKETKLFCNIPRAFLEFGKSNPSEVLEVEVGVKGENLWSNAVFLTLHNSSCSSCAPPSSPLLPTPCSSFPHLCHVAGQCTPLGGKHPSDPCQECGPGGWQEKENDGMVRSEVEYNLVVGQLLHYQLEDHLAEVKLVEAPTGAMLEEGMLKWRSSEEGAVIFLLSLEDECGLKENLEIKSKVSACPCLNEGACGGVEGDCQCPPGYQGKWCQLTNPCFPSPCHPGVSCDPRGDSYMCGPCPSGTQGDGHWCEKQMENGKGDEYVKDENIRFEDELNKDTMEELTEEEGEDASKGKTISASSLCEPSPCYPGVGCTARDWYFTCGPCPPPSRGDGISCYTLQPLEGKSYTQDGANADQQEKSAVGKKIHVEEDKSDNNSDEDKDDSVSSSTLCSYNDISCFADSDSPSSACSSSPCHAGVPCSNLPDDQFQCGSCPEGTVGDGQTCEIDWCSLEDQPCFPGVICHNLLGRAKCGNCPDGFEGNGVKCTPSVQPCSSNPCYYNVSCINVRMGASVGYVCGLCPEGMVGDGEDCRSTDPCSSAPCHPGVACFNLPDTGTFSCGPCPTGMVGDGKECHSIQEEVHQDVKDEIESMRREIKEEIMEEIKAAETEESSCNPACHPEVACKKGKCGFCPAGTEGNGITCVDIDDCQPSPCHPSVPCLDKPAPGRGYTCGPCPPPTIGDGVSCLLPTPTTCPADLHCYPGTTCLRLPGGRVLCGDCPPGMEGDGHYCRPVCPPHCNAHQHCNEGSSECEEDNEEAAADGEQLEEVQVASSVFEARVAPLRSPTTERPNSSVRAEGGWQRTNVGLGEGRNTSTAISLLSCRRTCRFSVIDLCF